MPMDLGEKLRHARLEAGLTQKQLCEGVVTRNMLSQIENGLAKPSMGTLTVFARRLGKSVSYFLEETALVSPNTGVMEQARALFDRGEFAQAAGVLEEYREPDSVYDREKQLLTQLCLLSLAEQAIRLGKDAYARQLLEKCREDGVYCADALKRRKLLLLGRISGESVSTRLPSLDEELMLRAREALREKNCERAAALLDACRQQREPVWQLLRGMVRMEQKEYEKAKQNLLLAQEHYPAKTAPLLEICFRELGDYKSAYEYACKQR
jgi:transcriptional regulator with XRE-family HTH domain